MPGTVGLLHDIDVRLSKAETAVAAGLLSAMFAVLLAGAVWRSLGAPLQWSDEAAVLLMCGAGFFGASAALGQRRHIAVEVLAVKLPMPLARIPGVIVQVVLLAGMAGFAVMLWSWFDLPGLWAAGSAQAFSEKTFNFIYQEPTVTLGVRKFWAWLVLIPFCAGCLIHALARLADIAGERR